MDAVTTLALALNNTLEDPSQNLSLQMAIEDIKFSGASVSYPCYVTYTIILTIQQGSVQFDSSGNRLTPIVLLQQFRMDLSKKYYSYCTC